MKINIKWNELDKTSDKSRKLWLNPENFDRWSMTWEYISLVSYYYFVLFLFTVTKKNIKSAKKSIPQDSPRQDSSSSPDQLTIAKVPVVITVEDWVSWPPPSCRRNNFSWPTTANRCTQQVLFRFQMSARSLGYQRMTEHWTVFCLLMQFLWSGSIFICLWCMQMIIM